VVPIIGGPYEGKQKHILEYPEDNEAVGKPGKKIYQPSNENKDQGQEKYHFQLVKEGPRISYRFCNVFLLSPQCRVASGCSPRESTSIPLVDSLFGLPS